MAAFLVTGNPGSGKTAMAAELTRLGFSAFDADELAGRESASGTEVSQPHNATDEWLLSHRWVWSRRRMEEKIRSQPPGQHVFVCGISMNQRDMLDLFDTVFLLSLDQATQVARLDTPGNPHRNAALRAEILDGRPVFEREMKVGAVVLDGRQPIAFLTRRIVEVVHSRGRRGDNRAPARPEPSGG
jgi:dephospho-CoA kinase